VLGPQCKGSSWHHCHRRSTPNDHWPLLPPAQCPRIECTCWGWQGSHVDRQCWTRCQVNLSYSWRYIPDYYPARSTPDVDTLCAVVAVPVLVDNHHDCIEVWSKLFRNCFDFDSDLDFDFDCYNCYCSHNCYCYYRYCYWEPKHANFTFKYSIINIRER